MIKQIHPGEKVRQIITDCGITVTEAAHSLGITRQTLDRLLNRKGGLSPEMAIRLSLVFGGTAESWYQLQVEIDLAAARSTDVKINKSYSIVKTKERLND